MVESTIASDNVGNAIVTTLFWGFGELAQLITALSLSLVAIILGYVFPKSQGSLNETTSLLLLFVFVLVSLLTNRSLVG